MVPRDAITAWAVDHPWPTAVQVEQDLLLSRAICAIAADPYLGEELVFRGGTALHKLHVQQAFRYSEDLDYVRSTGGGIGQLTRALTDIGESLGFDVRTRITEHPKVYWRTTSAEGTPIRIKIEVNTHECSPALSHAHIGHQVESEWWTGDARVRTFQTAELIATKIRALYQRSKGRDLFDLWLALTELDLTADEILTAFSPYRPDGLTAEKAEANLRAKINDPRFRADLAPLVADVPHAYSIEAAADLVINKIHAQLE
jgi:predicted nucleotidyltransferase component of viral defense system